VNHIDEALHALLRLQRKLIGRGSGASCCTDAKIVKIREEFKTIKDTITRLKQERDAARRVAAHQYAKHHNGDEDTLVKNFFEFRGWDCHKEKGHE
jgi:hypothetical protein